MKHLHLIMSLRVALSSPRGNLLLNGKNFLKRGDCSPAPGAGAGVVVASLLLAMTLLISSCLPLISTPPTATPLPMDTAAPTQTIVWFPPSATPTLLTVSTSMATLEMNPGIGTLTLNDNFDDEKLWDTAVSDQGSAAIGNNRLSIAVQSNVYLVSMRHDLTVSDFYAEITARPSLCRGDDNYGILVRTIGKASFYRFLLTCDGQIYAERISGGVKLQVQAPIPSGDAPRPPGEVRIGMWAVGSDMRLFLNGRYQFSITDKQFPSGAFGVFVRSAGDELVSVTFSDFEVYKVDYVPPTKTPLP